MQLTMDAITLTRLIIIGYIYCDYRAVIIAYSKVSRKDDWQKYACLLCFSIKQTNALTKLAQNKVCEQFLVR